MKIYLAGPMRGYPEHNFPAFHAWAKQLRDEGYEVFSPAEKGEEARLKKNPDLQNDLDFRREVFLMDTTYICKHADAVALMPGWEKSPGANAERALAMAIGIPVYYLQQDLKYAYAAN